VRGAADGERWAPDQGVGDVAHRLGPQQEFVDAILLGVHLHIKDQVGKRRAGSANLYPAGGHGAHRPRARSVTQPLNPIRAGSAPEWWHLRCWLTIGERATSAKTPETHNFRGRITGRDTMRPPRYGPRRLRTQFAVLMRTRSGIPSRSQSAMNQVPSVSFPNVVEVSRIRVW
jgi:hypothetical protein